MFQLTSSGVSLITWGKEALLAFKDNPLSDSIIFNYLLRLRNNGLVLVGRVSFTS